MFPIYKKTQIRLTSDYKKYIINIKNYVFDIIKKRLFSIKNKKKRRDFENNNKKTSVRIE